ncbi:S-layer homology domain-containing protein [Clostridium formicaceticum]|uniref:Endo-1,4-beta-xylanase A n=1 Tax=Clostridium formicaceticum TaxID=1497 RepID=A0AAC9WFR6_9CLOT|nr:S-layer homology domain-containing protein [Clostridium formicaceticum]AOY76623.1 hypothetical protein BJL90_12570 [Clostridium formicaceticum]ARE87046.1 Endo-1,4-beta-xylanase A precursor [Clostridium formicaceticum]
MKQRKYKKPLSKFLAFIMILLTVFGQIGFGSNTFPVEAAEKPVLMITGTGLEEDVVLYESDFNKYQMVEKYFSSNNSQDFHKITKVKGYDFFNLIGEENLKTDQNYNIVFTASDGFSVTKSVYELQSTYYYPDFIEANGELISPIIAFYKNELISIGEDAFNPPITWADEALTEADKLSTPQLLFGQTNINDKNQSKWVSKLTKIQVGNERPQEETVLSIKGNAISATKNLTISQLKAMPAQYQIDEDYQYNSKGGLKTVAVKGVDLWYVLNTVVGITDPTAKVQFVASDGYPVDPQLQADIANPSLKYVLAYEIDGAAVNDDDGKAKLRIYRKQKEEIEFGTVFQAIHEIEINNEENTNQPIDFINSPYKHIGYDGAPYNIDSITGATLTIEGPGVESYRAISVRQIQESNAGLFRGTYEEKIGGQELQNSYEGITVDYLLDNFVTLRSNAGKVIFKNKSRQVIGEYSLEDIRKTDYRNNVSGENNLRMIVAYGVNEVPLMYLNTDLGYIPSKYNDDGCLKLVMGQKTASDPVTKFSNVAYIYVTEKDAPGVYEHAHPPYNDPKYTNYVLTLTGTGIGKEVNYTVKDIEAMTDLHLEKEYSLSNSQSYWYYNTYKGVPLWELLIRAGLDPNIDENTRVQMIAADNYNFPAMTIREIKNQALYGYYEKDPNDLGDGSFNGSGVEPLETGYSPLVAYGYNGYPYVIRPSDAGYNSGLGNDGGPLRIIFGKKSYGHTNGSEQVQFAKKIIIGEDQSYTTHTYAPYDTLANNRVEIEVIGDGSTVLSSQSFTVQDIEKMVYNVSAAERDKALFKNYYFTKLHQNDKISDLYEGVSLKYLLLEKIGFPGTTGSVTFENANGDTLTVPLDNVTKENYYNEVTGANNLKAILAYAKNGHPMVVGKQQEEGYVSSAYNNGGPLMVVMGQKENGVPGDSISNVVKITVNIEKDGWAHLYPPFDSYASSTLKISGNGAKKQQTVTVGQLEALQNYIIIDEYCLVKNTEEKYVDTYRGIDFYEYLRKEIGLQASAVTVKIVDSDGYSRTFTMEEIAKTNYINEVSGANNLRVMLAYGKNGKPLVASTNSEGYDAEAKNNGGPLRFVIGQTQTGDLNNAKSVSDVAEIVIEAAEGDSWKHDFGVYTQYQDKAVLRVTGSQVKEPRTFSLKQLEDMNAIIVRNTYTGDGTPELEGIILWDLIKDVVGLKDDVTIPSAITAFEGAAYNRGVDLNWVMNGVKNSSGENREIILAYARNGYPLVPNESSPGYDNNNAYGPLRLIVEAKKDMWIKNTDCIVVGTGNYEAPKEEDIIHDEEPPTPITSPITLNWTIYSNDGGSGLPWAAVRCVTADEQGGLWVGTNGGGVAYKNAEGNWTVYNKDNSPLPHNTVYSIAVDDSNGVWFVGGSPEDGMGAVYKKEDAWTIYTKDNSPLPANFAQSVVLDKQGGVWFGTSEGAAYRDKNHQWTVYNKSHGFPADSVTQILLDNKGGVWVGFYPPTQSSSGGGYAYIDPQGQVTTYTDDSAKWVRSISFDKDGGVWVARFGKVDYISPSGERTIYTDKELVPSLAEGNSIRVAIAEANGGLWIGTTTGGLLYRDAAGNIAVYDYTNTWPTSQFNSIWYLNINDQGDFWVGTNGGVAYNKLSGYDTIVPPNPGDDTQDPGDGGGNSGGDGTTPVTPPIGNWSLEITGPGMNEAQYFTVEDLKSKGGSVSANYFFLNQYGTQGYVRYRGISLAYLLDEVVGVNSSARSVSITAQDGYRRQYNLSDVRRDYIDQNKSSARLQMILAWEEDGRTLTGQYPLKLVMGQTEAGDVNKPNWVSNVKTISVNTESVTSGGGSSPNYSGSSPSKEEEVDEEINTTEDVKHEISTDENGRVIEEIIWSAKDNDLLLNKEDGSSLILQSQGDSDCIRVQLPASVLNVLRDKKMELAIKSDVANYYLPIEALLASLGEELLEVDLEDMSLTIEINKVTEEVEEAILASLAEDQELLSGAVEFKIFLTANDKKQEITSFGNTYVKREILTSSNINTNQATGVVWNEATRKFEYVPTVFTVEENGTYATIFSRSNSIYTVIESDKTFRDIEGHWAKKHIETLTSKNIVSGKGETTFDPDAAITRAEFAALLVKAMGLGEKQLNQNTFNDITNNEWYSKYVATAAAEGIVSGYTDYTFRPYNVITREEMVVMLTKALKVVNQYQVLDNSSIDQQLSKFEDEEHISAWAREAVAIANQAGIATGVGNNTFDPQANASRAETVVMLRKFLTYIDFMNE